MYTVNISISLVNQIDKRLNAIFKKIRDKANELLEDSNDYQELSKKLDEYITSYCDAEIRSISSSIYFDLYEQTSKSEIFANPKLANEFHSMNMRNYISENCQFKMEKTFSYQSKDCKKISIVVCAGVLVVGSIISIGTAMPWGITLSIVLSIIAYYIAFKIIQKENLENYSIEVELYLKELEIAFGSWVENFEKFYSLTVDNMLHKIN